MNNLRYAKGWCALNPIATAVLSISPWATITCRVGDFWPGVKSEVPLVTTNKSLAEICAEQAAHLWSLHQKLIVLWSGGMDSSLVATVLALSKPEGSELMLASAEGSSPDFDSNLVEWFFSKGVSFCQADELRLQGFVSEGWHVVTGVHADTLLSGDIVRYGNLYTLIHDMGLKDLISKMLRTEDTQKINKMYERLLPLIELMPLPKTGANLAWWLDYTCAWDIDSMATWRLFGVHPNNYTDFFGAIDFQKWAVKDAKEKIGNTADTHKQLYFDLLKSLVPFTPNINRTEVTHEMKDRGFVGNLVGITEDWELIVI